ncbi:unnamed protein product [Pleuronectes platessa]|uniref:Uncharacterized protein n=1 Tax=Pleuronectes platessa TaxID=8262 RepID=A0A9N7U5N6_PLEPL|nr:unnamed protein product [Pleuronectes platessa]
MLCGGTRTTRCFSHGCHDTVSPHRQTTLTSHFATAGVPFIRHHCRVITHSVSVTTFPVWGAGGRIQRFVELILQGPSIRPSSSAGLEPLLTPYAVTSTPRNHRTAVLQDLLFLSSVCWSDSTIHPHLFLFLMQLCTIKNTQRHMSLL